MTGQLFQRLLVTVLSRTENHKLAALFQQIRHHGHYPVHPFLLHQSANETKKRRAVHFQPKLVLQCCPTLNFVLQMVTSVVKGQLLIFLRVPDPGVDAVENAGQGVLPVPEQTIEAIAEFRSLNLTCIGGADGGDPITEYQAALDKRKLAIELQLFKPPEGVGQTEGAERLVGEEPLVGKVMNGKHGARPLLIGFQEYRYQPGLPVIAMHQIGPPVQTGFAHGDHGPHFAKQLKPVGVVPPVSPFLVFVGVAGAIEKGRAVNQPESNRGAWQPSLPQAHIVLAKLESGLSAGTGFSGGLYRVRVTRQENLNIVFKTTERFGQAGRNIGKTAGLHQWIDFTGGK